MNIATGKNAEGDYILYVLEPGNIHMLKEGKPIFQRVEAMFPDGIPKKLQLCIMFSETPVADAKNIAAEAGVALDERTPKMKEAKPHCPECKSTIEGLTAMRSNESPIALVFCHICGCTLGTVA